MVNNGQTTQWYYCVVCPLLTIVLSVLCWPLSCLSFDLRFLFTPLVPSDFSYCYDDDVTCTIYCTVCYCWGGVWLERSLVFCVIIQMVCGLNDSLYCSLLFWWCVTWTVHCTVRYCSDGVWLERFIILLVTALMVCSLNDSLYCSLLLWCCVTWTVHCTARYCSYRVWCERFIVLNRSSHTSS
jgi:hypothetical protein